MIARFWHRHVLGHEMRVRHVSPPLWDISARGYLYRCSCGKEWAT